MTAVQIEAASAAVGAGAVLITAVTWLVSKVHSAISRAARNVADAEFRRVTEEMGSRVQATIDRVGRQAERDTRISLATSAIVLGAVTALWLHLAASKKGNA